MGPFSSGAPTLHTNYINETKSSTTIFISIVQSKNQRNLNYTHLLINFVTKSNTIILQFKYNLGLMLGVVRVTDDEGNDDANLMLGAGRR
jgi:hypothetical protein